MVQYISAYSTDGGWKDIGHLQDGQCPSCKCPISFHPPSVEYAEMYCTIHYSLFTACTRSFEWPGGRIKPDINPSYKIFCQFNIIILKEYHLPGKLGHLRYFKNYFY